MSSDNATDDAAGSRPRRYCGFQVRRSTAVLAQKMVRLSDEGLGAQIEEDAACGGHVVGSCRVCGCQSGSTLAEQCVAVLDNVPQRGPAFDGVGVMKDRLVELAPCLADDRLR
jgi:hypothetical protein